MIATSSAVRQDTAVVKKSEQTLAKLRQLAAQTPYNPPKIISFPINGMSKVDSLTLAGNF